MSNEAAYAHFASRISFFDFREDLPEFKEAELDFTQTAEAATVLGSRKDWTVDALASFVRLKPVTFKVLEALFQQLRFTNSQLASFAFEVKKLNANLDIAFEYARDNLLNDQNCSRLFLQACKGLVGASFATPEEAMKELTKEHIVACFKIAISEYIEKVAKDFEILAGRISNPKFTDVSLRFAKYTIETLRLNAMLNAVDPAKFLQEKRIPADTKALHGKYAKYVLKGILERNGYSNLDDHLQKQGLSTFGEGFALSSSTLDGDRGSYCTEKSVRGIVTDKGKPKRFDLILFVGGRPKHLFEVNFYSTGGTKIGINESEYVTLHREIQAKTRYKFHWITDGNYWLTQEGKERFNRLTKVFGHVYNMNTFEENLGEFR